jgi:hypothetical protein
MFEEGNESAQRVAGMAVEAPACRAMIRWGGQGGCFSPLGRSFYAAPDAPRSAGSGANPSSKQRRPSLRPSKLEPDPRAPIESPLHLASLRHLPDFCAPLLLASCTVATMGLP